MQDGAKTWDCEVPLVTLEERHLASVLRRYRNNELSSSLGKRDRGARRRRIQPRHYRWTTTARARKPGFYRATNSGARRRIARVDFVGSIQPSAYPFPKGLVSMRAVSRCAFGLLRVKRRPSGAADLGLLIAQQRTSGDGRSPSEKCQNPTPEFRPRAGLTRVSGAIFRRSNRMAQTRNLLRPSVCKTVRRPGQPRSQGVPLPYLPLCRLPKQRELCPHRISARQAQRTA